MASTQQEPLDLFHIQQDFLTLGTSLAQTCKTVPRRSENSTTGFLEGSQGSDNSDPKSTPKVFSSDDSHLESPLSSHVPPSADEHALTDAPTTVTDAEAVPKIGTSSLGTFGGLWTKLDLCTGRNGVQVLPYVVKPAVPDGRPKVSGTEPDVETAPALGRLRALSHSLNLGPPYIKTRRPRVQFARNDEDLRRRYGPQVTELWTPPGDSEPTKARGQSRSSVGSKVQLACPSRAFGQGPPTPPGSETETANTPSYSLRSGVRATRPSVPPTVDFEVADEAVYCAVNAISLGDGQSHEDSDDLILLEPPSPKDRSTDSQSSPGAEHSNDSKPVDSDVPAPARPDAAPKAQGPTVKTQAPKVTEREFPPLPATPLNKNVSKSPALVPSAVRPATLNTPKKKKKNTVQPVIQPVVVQQALVSATLQIPFQTQPYRASPKPLIRTREDQDWDFLKTLIDRFPSDKKTLVSPMRLLNESITTTGIHVFIDASNMQIGFKELLKRTPFARSELSFDCLALLLERRRPVAKRIFAGSTRLAAPILSQERFTELAGAVGYERLIYEQVYKSRELTDRQKFFKEADRIGWGKAMQQLRGVNDEESDPDTGSSESNSQPLQAPKWVEQGVDESLHLKMCQSIIDVEVPSTMVVATGDGAAAEFSDGFLAHVERALRKGWAVELVSWKMQLNSGYRAGAFRKRWGERFRVIELDDFVEFLFYE